MLETNFYRGLRVSSKDDQESGLDKKQFFGIRWNKILIVENWIKNM